MAKLIAYKDIDHGIGCPYLPNMHRHYLYRSDQLVHGKRYYTTIDGSSISWITNEITKKLLTDWNIV